MTTLRRCLFWAGLFLLAQQAIAPDGLAVAASADAAVGRADAAVGRADAAVNRADAAVKRADAPVGRADAAVVILLSWDGVRADYLDRPSVARLPALRRLREQGSRLRSLRPGWPSSTFPGHATLATGTWADRHGIVDNDFIDRRRGRLDRADIAAFLNAEPLWIAAERQGVPTATFFWVGAETNWLGKRPRYRVAPFDGGVDEPAKVRQILAWLDLPPSRAPRLIMSWWHGADTAGHDHGPRSVAIGEALREQDAALGALLAGIDARKLWHRTTLLVVSDHGMAEVREVVELRALLDDLGVDASVTTGSAVAHLFLQRRSDIGKVERALRKRGLATFRNAAVPAELRLRHATRTGDLVAVAPSGVGLSDLSGVSALAFLFARHCCAVGQGAHGYDPAMPEMHGILLAVGRGVPRGALLPTRPQIDVAPTVARLLGIAPPRDSEGQPITEFAVTARE